MHGPQILRQEIITFMHNFIDYGFVSLHMEIEIILQAQTLSYRLHSNDAEGN